MVQPWNGNDPSLWSNLFTHLYSSQEWLSLSSPNYGKHLRLCTKSCSNLAETFLEKQRRGNLLKSDWLLRTRCVTQILVATIKCWILNQGSEFKLPNWQSYFELLKTCWMVQTRGVIQLCIAAQLLSLPGTFLSWAASSSLPMFSIGGGEGIFNCVEKTYSSSSFLPATMCIAHYLPFLSTIFHWIIRLLISMNFNCFYCFFLQFLGIIKSCRPVSWFGCMVGLVWPNFHIRGWCKWIAVGPLFAPIQVHAVVLK